MNLAFLFIVALACLRPKSFVECRPATASSEEVVRGGQANDSLEDFTFTRNGSYLQIDAGREWPFNSKREISFRFKTKSPHGLLIHQTFDHSKIHREDDQERTKVALLGGGGGGGGPASALGSFAAPMYELYMKLENGRLKAVYEFGARLNQTYCGKSLNDDRWHRVDLKVDPEVNQMVLTLDQMINVELALSQILHEPDDGTRRNELAYSNSLLYIGGLNQSSTPIILKNARQRLHMAQFVGCIGQIMLKTDQSTESALQPAPFERLVHVRRGCRNLCDTNNYCLHNSSCLNYYTHTKCDCFGTNYEDVYCWQDKLTTLSMLGYSTLVYRIYDWRDRHHTSNNRFSMQFKTLARDSILFFAYGDLSAQQAMKNPLNFPQQQTNSAATSTNLVTSGFGASQLNVSAPPALHRPQNYQIPSNNNYLALSLVNGSLVAEISFGDQPILLSNLLQEKLSNSTSGRHHLNDSNHLLLSDGHWHNVTLTHSGKQLALHLDGQSVSHTVLSKNNHLYFDPSIYVGGAPNFLLNETKALLKPINLRYKFVGCMRSVYFNQQNILLDLKRGSSMVEYRDLLGRPLLDQCDVIDPNSLPVTLRSGKSYLTFQLSPGPAQALSALRQAAPKMDAHEIKSNVNASGEKGPHQPTETQALISAKKLTWIEFEYKTLQTKHFLAGGHLRDLSYHDLGGFWTLQAREECLLYFTISSGLTFDPEQVLVLGANGKRCEPGQWYKVSISIMSGDKALNITRTSVDKEHTSESSDHASYMLGSSVELLHQVQLGGDLAKFGESSSIPFSGCIRHIIINGHSFDSRDFVTTSSPVLSSAVTNINPQNFTQQSQLVAQATQYDVISSKVAQGYVTIDSCQLVNPCVTLNPCKNGGVCKVNELGEPDCDCSKTGYTGRRCHFSIYKRSCQDLYLSGQRKSSFYLIDLDRNGPLKPVRVRCNMDSGFNHIETSLSHNLPAEYLVRRSSSTDIFFDVTYLAFHHMYTHDGFYSHDDSDDSARSQQDLMLRALIGQSSFCKQHFRYECRSAPLNLGNKTWMETPYPKRRRLMSLNGGSAGTCACAASEKRCIDPRRSCNCDSGESIWSDDSSDLIGREQVGITRIVLLKQDEDPDPTAASQSPAKQALGNVESQSRISLSELKCYGTVEHGNQHEITFKTSDAYIEVPGWRRGDISFNFRTASSPPAIILYQLATSRNHGYFRLTLITDTRLLFEFIVNRRPRRLFLIASHRLNNGEWQQVFIEYDSANIRLTVNDDSVLVDLDPNDHLGTFEGPLYIGGAPTKYLIGDLSRRNGFTGCFKGLNINGRSVDLNDYLSSTMPTVISGCQPSCKKNLCQNGGKCIEYWGSYECECSNPIAHSGSNCEINLNTNSITFITPESHYVEKTEDSQTHPPYLMKSILLNIRTYQETALVLYAHDQFDNFIQLHKNGSSLVLTFNSNATIVNARVPIDDESANPSLVDVSNQPATNTAPTILPETQNNLAQLNLTSANLLIMQNRTANLQTATQLQKQQSNLNQNSTNLPDLGKFSIRVSNTSGSGQPIQIKIERHRLRTTFYVNNNFVVVEKPLLLLTNYAQSPWLNPELELVRPLRTKALSGSKTISRIFLANIDEHFSTRLPGFTGCIQGFSIDNQLFDFNRAHLTGEMKGDYKIGCKMHCDSVPCKNQGTCVENWLEDKIQCKCDATSYVGRLCDEDIAAMFNGVSSHFIYNINRKLTADHQMFPITHLKLTVPDQSSDLKAAQNLQLTDIAAGTNSGRTHSKISDMNFLEVSLAFSSETSQSTYVRRPTVQVILWITHANSSRYFFLGLTSDGGLLIQEDYGNSMSLSRLIKKPEQPFNDGYRHMVKYSRLNQTIQITVDHQTFLPTMSIIAANRINKFSKDSLIIIGTPNYQRANKSAFAMEEPPLQQQQIQEDEYVNYNGCISNLIVRLDSMTVEPLSEAFGQNLETINVNLSGNNLDLDMKDGRPDQSFQTTNPKSGEVHNDYTLTNLAKTGELLRPRPLLNIVDKVSRQDVREDMETMITQDVEQGKCASFRRIENSNEKRSVNEPKFTQLLDPRPAYMDPPRIKLYDRSDTIMDSDMVKPIGGVPFYISLTFLTLIGSSLVIYAYILQLRYNSEKFRCETPFFHNKREDTPTGNMIELESDLSGNKE